MFSTHHNNLTTEVPTYQFPLIIATNHLSFIHHHRCLWQTEKTIPICKC